MDQQRALLDMLMGKDRDLDETEKRVRHWDDPDICQNYICGFCPHDLFRNTKSDLGPCEKDHDDKMTEEFRRVADDATQNRLERRFLRTLQALIAGVDQRVRKGEERLNLSGDSVRAGPYTAQLQELTTKIRELQSEMEQLGEEGKIDEMQKLMDKVNELKEEKAQLENKSKTLFNSTEQTAMKMCPVCGIWKSDNPEDSRAKNHYIGKQHVGFQQIRDKVIELEKKFGNSTRSDPDPPERERDRRSRSRERDREKDRDRDRDRERDRRRKSRSRSGSRSRDRRRSSRDQRRRSRSRSRSRSKSRSRSRSRRHRR